MTAHGDRPLRVALIVANIAPRYGGPAYAALAYAEALALAGAQVRVVTTTQDGDGHLPVPVGELVQIQTGYDIVHYHPEPTIGSRPASWSFAYGIIRAMQWADIAHVSSLYLPHNSYVYLASKIGNTPYIARPHGTLEHYQRQFSRRAKHIYDHIHGHRYLRRAAGFHFTSKSEAQAAADLVGHERSFVLPIPLTPPTIPADPGTSKTVIFLGRVTAKKRVDLLIQAWPKVHAAHPDAHLLIAGPVDHDQQYQLHNLGPGIQTMGLIQGKKKTETLRRAALFVLPSQNENFGVAVAEAMSWGLPVVISDQVALAPDISSKGLGSVLSDITPDRLSDVIGKWLQSPHQRTLAGQSARKFVADNFGLYHTGLRLKNILDKFIENSRCARRS